MNSLCGPKIRMHSGLLRHLKSKCKCLSHALYIHSHYIQLYYTSVHEPIDSPPFEIIAPSWIICRTVENVICVVINFVSCIFIVFHFTSLLAAFYSSINLRFYLLLSIWLLLLCVCKAFERFGIFTVKILPFLCPVNILASFRHMPIFICNMHKCSYVAIYW